MSLMTSDTLEEIQLKGLKTVVSVPEMLSCF